MEAWMCIKDVRVYAGDCLDVLRELPEKSVDSLVTDAPYGLSDQCLEDVQACLRAWLNGERYEHGRGGVGGELWDGWVPGPEIWREAYRVLKPGGHLATFSSNRTMDLMGIGLRLAGFENRLSLYWLYADKMNRGYDISKGIDKYYGCEREVVGVKRGTGCEYSTVIREMERRRVRQEELSCRLSSEEYSWTAPTHPMAKMYDQWNTALKPSVDPILVFRRPIEGTVVENTLKYGVGGLNIKANRIGASTKSHSGVRDSLVYGNYKDAMSQAHEYGRFPNLTLVQHMPGCEEGVTCEEGCISKGLRAASGLEDDVYCSGLYWCEDDILPWMFSGKVSSEEKEGGLEHLPPKYKERRNHHVSVKPTAVMRWLVRLLTPPLLPSGEKGHVLDLFAGTGTTGVAAINEGMRCTLIEREESYLPLIEGRLHKAVGKPLVEKTGKQVKLFGG